MEALIRILFLEDEPADVELVQSKLAQAGLACRVTCVQERNEFETCLCDGATDIILADYRLPTYDGMSALRLANERCPDIPFIFVSGIMGEEAAIEALTQGATDYVLKHNLSRLAPAVKRALQEMQNRCERQRVERALQKSEAKIHSILDLVDEGFIVIDQEYCILSANKAFCAMVNQSEDQVLGRTCYEVIRHNGGSCFRSVEECPVQYALEIGQSSFVTHTHMDASGEHQHVELKSYPIIDQSGTVTSVIMTLNNITERKILQDQLRQAQKMEAIGTLSGGIAHDFNNILFPIVGMAEMLMEDLAPGSQEYENIEEIYKAGKRGSDLVKQILAFSCLSEHRKIPVRVQPVLREVLKLSRSTIPADIEIKQDIQSDCGLVLADATQLHQVFMNLIINAYHAVEQASGKISVTLKKTVFESRDLVGAQLEPGPYAMLSITDTGCGIPAAIMDKIFQPYFTTKGQGKGTGLGLAVVYGIVKDHGGDIKVYSEVGKGTTFNVYLPLIRKSSDELSVRKTEIDPTGTERILLVDDEEAVARTTGQMLERLGYRVTSRISSLDAIETFKANPEAYDLVITDMTMPNMTGDRLAEKLIRIKPGIPIIICTGFSERISQDNIDSFGIKGFLMKPIVKSDMARMIRKMLV